MAPNKKPRPSANTKPKSKSKTSKVKPKSSDALSAVEPKGSRPKAKPKAPNLSKKEPTVRKHSRAWIWGGLALLLVGVLYLAREPLLQLLRWVERRHFAHIGDQGPLRRISREPWQRVAVGLSTRTLRFKRKQHWSQIRLRLMRIDPKHHRVALWWDKKPRSIRWIMKNTQAIAAINGGLFEPSYRPLGYFVANGTHRNRRVHRRSIDGVFLVKDGKIQIRPSKLWQPGQETLAFQSAPLLVAEGKLRPLPRKPWKVDRRSALCLDQRGQLLLMSTDGFVNGLSYYELGLLMAASPQRGGLGCRWGLNLDGGSSSQWAIRTSSGVLSTSGVAVPLYLLIHPKAVSTPKVTKRRNE